MYGRYVAHVFDGAEVVEALVRKGGWERVAGLLAKVTNRKRKRADLDERREAAAAKRRAALEAWAAKTGRERLPGKTVQTVTFPRSIFKPCHTKRTALVTSAPLLHPASEQSAHKSRLS